MALAAIAAAVIGLGTPGGVARAQNASSTNAATAAPPAAAAAHAPALPSGAAEVVKLYKGGIDKDVIIDYINSTALPYHLSADGILYLRTLGIPQEVTKAMILRDGQQQQQQAAQQQALQAAQQMQQTVAQQQMPPPDAEAPPQAPPPVAAPATPAPTVTVIGSDYPAYYYGYPAYDYYYWPPVIIGGGWGWGHGGGWHGGGYHGGFGGGRGGGHR
jgi:hypothetical protein